MTDAPTIDRQDTLYVTDAELIRRLGVPENIAYATIRELDRDPNSSGFPQKQKLWGGRRYWPAVRAYLDRTSGLTIGASLPQRGRR
jgi:hypothetical protein